MKSSECLSITLAATNSAALSRTILAAFPMAAASDTIVISYSDVLFNRNILAG
jgi:hypothetical protein